MLMEDPRENSGGGMSGYLAISPSVSLDGAQDED
jgi:hypothetical protein